MQGSVRLTIVPILLGFCLGPHLGPQPFAQVTFERADSAWGVCVVLPSYGPTCGDYDADGFPDVFAGNHGGMPHLFHNQAGSGFDDRWEDAGIAWAGDRHGAAWGDYDNDGWRDLYVAVGAEHGEGLGYNQLYHNLDGAHFADVALISGTIDSTGRGRFPHWIDADNDGWLDLFVTNMDTPNRLFHNLGDGTFTPVEDAGGIDSGGLMYAGWTCLDDDVHMDVALSGDDGVQLALFRNRGDGTFEDISAASGLPTNLWFVQSLCWFDYDNDADQDLYLGRGFYSDVADAIWYDAESALFYFNMPKWATDEDGLDGVDLTATANGLEIGLHVDWTGYDFSSIYLGAACEHPSSFPFTVLDGQHLGEPSYTPGVDFGCYIWQDAPGGAWHFRASTDYAKRHIFGAKIVVLDGGITALDTVRTEVLGLDPEISNRLFRNNGNGTFAEVTHTAGVGDTSDSRTVIAADFDNDGWPDLYVVNARNVAGIFSQNQPNRLYRNNGNGTFSDVAAAAGVTCEVPGTGAGASWADFDDDGFLDLYVTNGWGVYPFRDGPHVVYRNQGNGNHWVKVRLVGVLSNRDATGTRVRLVAGGREQWRVQNGGVADMSQSSMAIHFGLGDATVVDSLTFYWPSGIVETYTELAADQTYEIVEMQSGGSVPPAEFTLTAAPPAPNPFRHHTALRYDLPARAHMELTIIDPAGRRLRTLFSGMQPAGPHVIRWDGLDESGARLPAGLYLARMATGDARRIARVILVD